MCCSCNTNITRENEPWDSDSSPILQYPNLNQPPTPSKHPLPRLPLPPLKLPDVHHVRRPKVAPVQVRTPLVRDARRVVPLDHAGGGGDEAGQPELEEVQGRVGCKVEGCGCGDLRGLVSWGLQGRRLLLGQMVGVGGGGRLATKSEGGEGGLEEGEKGSEGVREGKANGNKRERGKGKGGLFTCHAVLRWMKPSWASRSERGYCAGRGEGGGSVVIL